MSDKIAMIAMIMIILFVVLVFVTVIIKQPKKIKEWLLYAVVKAEKDLGSGTGQIKLRDVYDKFTDKYHVWSYIISFETFSRWVDAALLEMKQLLQDNKDIEKFVDEGTDKIQVVADNVTMVRK